MEIAGGKGCGTNRTFVMIQVNEVGSSRDGLIIASSKCKAKEPQDVSILGVTDNVNLAILAEAGLEVREVHQADLGLDEDTLLVVWSSHG